MSRQNEAPDRPALREFLELIARCMPPGTGWHTGSPFQIETSDGAVVYLVVIQMPGEDRPRWRAYVESPRV